MAGRAAVFLGAKYCLGDMIGQNASFPDAPLDTSRLALFTAFGTSFGVQNYMFFKLLDMNPFIINPWAKAVFSACADGLINVPLNLYPQFYFVKELSQASDPEVSYQQHFANGLAKYSNNYKADILASAGVFIPLGALNFKFVPLAWRTPFCAVFGMIFPIILSYQRGGKEEGLKGGAVELTVEKKAGNVVGRRRRGGG